MDSLVRLYAAAIVVPEPAAGVLRSFQEAHRLPAWEPSIPFHITLVSPFTTRETADMLAAQWERVTQRAPFTIRMDGFGRFDGRSSVFFARVAPVDRLSRLADDALAAIARLHNRRMHPFVPHVTLAAAGPRAAVDDYLARTSDVVLDESFVCDRFSMLRLDEIAHRWVAIRDFSFTL